MKKVAIKYTDRNGKQWWANSVNENNQTYSLIPVREDENFPAQHRATCWYGKNAEASVRDRIKNDCEGVKIWGKFHPPKWYGWSAEVVRFEEEPIWYFEIHYVLEHAYNDKWLGHVRRGFEFDDEKYNRCPAYTGKPRICDLDLEDLERYYKWRKLHYKGKVKEV